MQDFSLPYWIMKKHIKRQKDIELLSSASVKKTRRGKECAAFGVSLIARIDYSLG